jgi:hypothetical protein
MNRKIIFELIRDELGRLARSLSTHRALPTSADHLPPRGSSQRTNISAALDSVEIDCKVKTHVKVELTCI